jgi:micrococcal nuclease
MHYLIFLFSFFIQQNEFTAQITTVEDGDSFEVITADKKKIMIRLFGVDCPEDGQGFSSKAKLFVEAMCKGKNLKIVKNTIDPKGRLVADVYLPDGKSIAKELIKAGYGWHYKQYSNDKELDQLEQEARKGKKGLWIENNPLPPWDYRASKQNKSQQAKH